MHYHSYKCPNCVPYTQIIVAETYSTLIQQTYEDKPSKLSVPKLVRSNLHIFLNTYLFFF